MKKLKLIFLFLLLALIVATLTACPINPPAFAWEINNVRLDLTYINGATINTELRQGAHAYRPYGITTQTTYIKFFEDKTLIFKPMNENELRGTYKTKNNGLKNTTIRITLENGDKIEVLATGGYFDDTLHFEYKNIKYEFSSRVGYDDDPCDNPNEYNERLRLIASEIRYYYENRVHVLFGEVVLDANGAILNVDNQKFDLNAENLGVIAIRITDNNELIYLDRIEEGECVLMSIPTLKEGETSLITFFYVDPLPNFEQENPTPLSISDLIPEITGYFDEEALENITVSLSNEPFNIRPGYYNTYRRVTDKTIIQSILSELEDLTLWDYGPPNESYFENTYSIDTLRITDETGTLPEIVISNYYDRIKIGDKYYYHKKINFYNYVYYDSYQMFICENYQAAIYKYKTLVGYTDILKNIEYIVDPENYHNYSTLKLVTEFGEITVYDATHFWYKGESYLVVGQTTFEELFQIIE